MSLLYNFDSEVTPLADHIYTWGTIVCGVNSKKL